MTDIDSGRKFDLEELKKLKDSAKDIYSKQIWEKMMYDIIEEKQNVKELRKKLILAVRHNDMVTIKRCNYLLDLIKLKEKGKI